MAKYLESWSKRGYITLTPMAHVDMNIGLELNVAPVSITELGMVLQVLIQAFSRMRQEKWWVRSAM